MNEKLFWQIWGKVTPFIVVGAIVFAFTFWFFYMDHVTEYLYLATYYDNLAYESYHSGLGLGTVNYLSGRSAQYCEMYQVYRFGFLPAPLGPRDDYDLFCEAIINRSSTMSSCCKLGFDNCDITTPPPGDLERIKQTGADLISWKGCFSFVPIFFQEDDLDAFECYENIDR